MTRVIASAWAAAAALTMAGCERGVPETDTRAIEVPAGDYQARLVAMPAATRDATFLRAIRDAGRDCQSVQRSAPAGTINDAPAWTATCEDGAQWTIAIGRDGIAQVMSTAELVAAAARQPRR